MTCDELMKRKVLAVNETHTVQRAAEIMAEGQVGFLPVCNERGRAIGAITDRDITIRVVARGRSPATTTVGEVMTREVVSSRARDDLAVAEQLMAQHHKSRIVITDENGHLRGVISLSDIAQRDGGRRASITLRHIAVREARGG